jgi:hypothetical protein
VGANRGSPRFHLADKSVFRERTLVSAKLIGTECWMRHLRRRLRAMVSRLLAAHIALGM